MSELKLTADSGGGSVSLKGPASTTGNAAVPFVLPVADGSAGQYLKTDGSKNLGWATDQGGKILQVVSNNVAGGSLNDTSSSSHSDTGLSINITPSATSSKIIVTLAVSAYHHGGGGDTGAEYLVQRKIDSGSYSILTNVTSAASVNTFYIAGTGNMEIIMPLTFIQYDAPNTTGVCNYKLTYAATGGGSIGLSTTNKNGIATAWEIAG